MRSSRFRIVSFGARFHGAPAAPTRLQGHSAGTQSTRLEANQHDPVTHKAREGAADALKLKLLQDIAGTNRGALAKLARHRRIEDVIDELEQQSPHDAAKGFEPGSPSALDGEWELVYTTAEAFRSSPFFWAFQEGLVQDQDLAAAIFRFTDSIPGVEVGRAVQRIHMATASLVSEVDLAVFPGLRGSVVTECTLSGGNDSVLKVTVANTRVAGSNLFPFLNSIVVPVQDIFDRIRGSDSTSVAVACTYIDADLRICRTKHDGEIFVYRRVK